MNIDLLMPAKHSVQPEIKSVVLVDNSVAFRGKDVHKVKTIDSKLSIDTIWLEEYATLTLSALKEELQGRQFFDSVYFHDEPLKENKNLVNRAMSWQQVNDICAQYDAQAVIAFEKNMYSTFIEVKRMYDGYLFGYLDVAGAILWRGYDNLNKDVIFQETQRDTISWDGDGGNINAVALKLPTLKNGLAEHAMYMGTEMANHIAPYWETQQRGYYISGNYHFIQAAEFVKKEQWGEAIKIWKYVFDHSQKKVKARAAYNLALASEILSDYESAEYWLDEGLDILGDLKGQSAAVDKRRLIQYSFYMSKRVKSIENLKEQIGAIQ
ncbi:DUF6340 family protein [Saccharicrinis sp. 156]|uniref:DUF6340 family protein n=1 Tax=Saccharicrinis sp. 156 TaxID=3417574 RepID=UPI003D357946